MSRRHRAQKREVLPDPKYKDLTVTKFMNYVMYEGKKAVAENIVYGAFDILADALAESRAGPAQLVRARLELHLLARGAGLEGEPLQQLVDEAMEIGDTGAAGYVRLQMAADALQARDAVGGEALADGARRDALDCTDPILYLNACLLMAEARDQRGDRVGMLTILFTCKASLQDILGEQGARPVLALIESLEARWGPEVFGAALEGYRAQFR